MALDVNPDSLRTLAGAIALLPKEIKDPAALGAQAVSDKLKGGIVGKALDKVDDADTMARGVLEARFNEFSALLALSADKFQNKDEDVANRLKDVADLNAGSVTGK